MRQSPLVRALGECLVALEQGETDISALADRYPDLKGELKPLLEIARKLRDDGTDPKPSPSFLLKLRRQLLKT